MCCTEEPVLYFICLQMLLSSRPSHVVFRGRPLCYIQFLQTNVICVSVHYTRQKQTEQTEPGKMQFELAHWGALIYLVPAGRKRMFCLNLSGCAELVFCAGSKSLVCVDVSGERQPGRGTSERASSHILQTVVANPTWVFHKEKSTVQLYCTFTFLQTSSLLNSPSAASANSCLQLTANCLHS